jgi:phage baseplate assembly protein V
MPDRTMGRWIEPLVARVGGLILRATVHAVDAAKKMQELTVETYKDDIDDEVEHLEPYGFTSHPKAPDTAGEAEAVTLEVGGNADHQVVLVVADRRFRLVGMAEGEVALYDDRDAKVHLTRSGIVIADPTLVSLGKAGPNPFVARVGDSVSVTIPTGAIGGSEALPIAPVVVTGTITSGSSKVDAE